MPYISNEIIKTFPSAVVVNTNAPIMTGSLTITPNTDGSITVLWPAATVNGSALPTRYEIYIAVGIVSSSTLFSTDNNVVKIVNDSGLSTSQASVFTLADQVTYLVNGQNYSIGVKAVSSNDIESGTGLYATTTAISSGNLYVGFQTLYTNMISGTGTINTNVLAVNTKLGTPAGATVSADIASIKSDTSTINSAGFITSIVNAIMTDPRVLTVAKFLGLK